MNFFSPSLRLPSPVLYFEKEGFPGGTSGKEPTYQFRRLKRHEFDPWVRKIPWKRKWQPTRVHAWRIPWTEEPGGLQPIRS